MAPSDSYSSPSRRFHTWDHAYKQVLAETDTHAMFKLVEIAEAAVLTRRASLEGSSNHHSERQAIEEALAHLRVVKKDRLRFL